MMNAPSQRKHGSIYVLVFSACLLLTTIGIGSLLAVRVQRHTGDLSNDAISARVAAQSAIAWGREYIDQHPRWRSEQTNGLWLTNQPLGTATLSLLGQDPSDSNLSDDSYDSVVLTGIGTKGLARHQTQVTLIADTRPLEALNCCLHAAGDLKITSGHSLVVFDAPLSTNGQLDNDDTIDGDAEASTIAHTGTISGTLTLNIDAKRTPDPNVIDDYIARATSITSPGIISGQILTADHNPWGSANAQGVYYIDAGNSDLTISNSRIQGTLIVDAGSHKVTIKDAVLIQPYRTDYPTLIIRGNAEILNTSASTHLSEANTLVNFNPLSAPYEGTWDIDCVDDYPNKIQGLVHVTGSLKLGKTARIEGAVICDSDVSCEGDNTIIHDATLYTSPPDGYTYLNRMMLSPRSYCQVVD